MRVKSQPKRYLDDDGRPIEEMEVSNSRYSHIAVKRLDDGLEVRALDETRDTVVQFQLNLVNELYKGVVDSEGKRRRDVDDDILDALHTVGYTLVDDTVTDDGELAPDD